jgi:protein-S-isoprenylcysteine O-methyltransferase Ste14
MRHVVYDITAVGTYLCWSVAALVWVITGRRARSENHAVRARDGRDGTSRVAGGLAVLVLVIPATVFVPLVVDAPALRLAGLVVLVSATVAAVAARLALGRMWSSGAVVRADHELRTSGAYRVTRHPVYSSILAMLTGTALAQGLGRWLPLLLIVVAALVHKTLVEERLLEREFPVDYPRYRDEVPRLVPRPRRPRVRAS